MPYHIRLNLKGDDDHWSLVYVPKPNATTLRSQIQRSISVLRIVSFYTAHTDVTAALLQSHRSPLGFPY